MRNLQVIPPDAVRVGVIDSRSDPHGMFFADKLTEVPHPKTEMTMVLFAVNELPKAHMVPVPRTFIFAVRNLEAEVERPVEKV